MHTNLPATYLPGHRKKQKNIFLCFTICIVATLYKAEYRAAVNFHSFFLATVYFSRNLGLSKSAFISMLILCLMAVHYFYHRVRTVLQYVLLVYMDQAACPLALAIITHLALPSMDCASAGKVQYRNIDSWWKFRTSQELCMIHQVIRIDQ